MSRSPTASTAATQQHKCLSNPDLPTKLQHSDNVNVRKRRQLVSELSAQSYEAFEHKINDQLSAWRSQIDKTISETISKTLHSILQCEIQKITSIINASLKQVNDRIDTIDKSITSLNDNQAALGNRLKLLEERDQPDDRVSSEVSILKEKLDSMEQQARSCNVEIANLPERRDENLLSILEKLANVILHPVSSCDVVSAHRVPHKSPTTARPKNVIVRFTTKFLRDNFIRAARAAKNIKSDQLAISGTVHHIYINEHLTIRNKQLFRLCRQRAAQHNYKYVWVKNGTILVRQTDTSNIFAVRNETEVIKIKSQ